MTTFFTSDNHWGHKRIREFCPTRPQATTVEQSDAVLIERWNDVVRRGDTVWHLGDLCFGSNEYSQHVLAQLNGELRLIIGNHDEYKRLAMLAAWRNEKANKRTFAYDTAYREIRCEGQKVVLCHYGCRVWNGSHRGVPLLFGHSHGTLKPYGKSVDVGFDAPWVTGEAPNQPLAWEQIKLFLDSRPTEHPDHHMAKEDGNKR